MSTSSTASRLAALEGLASAKRAIEGLLKRDGINAILLYGAPGSGKSTLAHILSQAWLCTSPIDNFACGECTPCRTHLQGSALDFQEIAPFGAGRMLRIQCIRPRRESLDFNGVPLSEFFRTRPLMARHKVIVLDQADRLNNDSAHALLKELEELGSHAKVILVTSELSRVIPTVRSRCLCIMCEVPPGQRETDSAQGLRRIFSRSYGEDLRVSESAAIFSQIDEVMRDLSAAPIGAALVLAQRTRAIASAYEDQLGLSARAANLEILAAIGRHLESSQPENPVARQDVAEAYRLVEQNVNAQMVFEDLFARFLI